MRGPQLLAIGLLLLVKQTCAVPGYNTTYRASTGNSGITPTASTNFSAHLPIENGYASTTSDNGLEKNVTDTTTYEPDEMENKENISFTSNMETSNSDTFGTPSLSDENMTPTTPSATYSLSDSHQTNSYDPTKDNGETEKVHYANNNNDFIPQKGITTSENPNSESITERSMSEMTNTSEDAIREKFNTTENPTSGSNSTNTETHHEINMDDTVLTVKSSGMTMVTQNLNDSKYEYVSQQHSDKEIQNSQTTQLQSTFATQPATVSESEYSRTESLMPQSANSSSTFTTDKPLLSSERTVLEEVQHSTPPNNLKIDGISQTWETSASTTPSQYQMKTDDSDMNYYSYSDEDYVTTRNTMKRDPTSSFEDILSYEDITESTTVNSSGNYEDLFGSTNSSLENTTRFINSELENITSWSYANIPVMIYKISQKLNSTGDDRSESLVLMTKVMSPRTTGSRKPESIFTTMSRHEYKVEDPVATAKTNHVTPVEAQTTSPFTEATTTEIHPTNTHKKVSVKSAIKLSESDRQLFPVTVVFETEMGVADWFHEYDDRYKQQLLETLNGCKELKDQTKRFQPNHVLHLTASPVSNGESLSISMVVLDPLAKEGNVYIDAYVLINCMGKGRKQYEALVDGKIMEMSVGVPAERRTRKESRLVLASGLAIVTIGFLIIFSVFLIIYYKLYDRKKPASPLKDVNQTSDGQNLVSDRDCTASEEQVPMQGTSTQEPIDPQEGTSRNHEIRDPKNSIVTRIDIHDTRL